MNANGARWPRGSGQWKWSTTLIVDDRPVDAGVDQIVVATPLDMITALESSDLLIASLVLAGKFASNGIFGAFVRECYPAVRVVESDDVAAAPVIESPTEASSDRAVVSDVTTESR